MLDTLLERFESIGWAAVPGKLETECWEWSGSIANTGYGRFNWQGKSYAAHRVAFQIHNSKIAPVVRHRCDNPVCVNPGHLLSGTHADNVRDREQRGRTSRGSARYNAKLTEQDVLDMRNHYTSKTMTQVAMATKYGVCVAHVANIVHGRKWKL